MLMGVFERLQKHTPNAIKRLKEMDNGVVKLFGSRPTPTGLGVAKCQDTLTRSDVAVPRGLKGHEHCMQRVFAAILHLKFGFQPEDINTLFDLETFKSLGTESNPKQFNDRLRNRMVIQWFGVRGVRTLARLQKPVVGDAQVRNLLRSIEPNTFVMTYPVDFQGLGRHCSMAYRPQGSKRGQVVLWDPSPVFENGDKCPYWLKHNETTMHVRGYSAARVLNWLVLPTKQAPANAKRAKKRARNAERLKGLSIDERILES